MVKLSKKENVNRIGVVTMNRENMVNILEKCLTKVTFVILVVKQNILWAYPM